MNMKNMMCIACAIFIVGCGAILKSKSRQSTLENRFMSTEAKLSYVYGKIARSAGVLGASEGNLTVFDLDNIGDVLNLVKEYDSLTSQGKAVVDNMLKTEDELAFFELCNDLLDLENAPFSVKQGADESGEFMSQEDVEEDYD